MSRVTKDIAEEVALKMTAPIKIEVDKHKKELADAMLVVMQNRIPQVVKDAFEKHPEYFDTIERVYLQGNGFNGQEVRTSKRFISKSGNYSTTVQLNDAEHKIIWDLYRKYEEKEKEYKDLTKSIETTLYQLKTYNAVGKNFVEAVPFLPERISTALMVPIDDIREKLSQYAGKTTEAGS